MTPRHDPRIAGVLGATLLGAKRKVGALLEDFGWGVVDIGGIAGARYLEAMCLTWVLAGVHGGNWNQAFKLLRG